MKNLKQLVLPCYKVEMAMSVEAWYFLHGSTDGVCNLTFFLSLLSRIVVEEVQNTKRGLSYTIHPGQADSSMLALAKEWGIGRKAAHRESGIPPDSQDIRRGTGIPFQRATIRDLALQFGKKEVRKTDRRNGEGNRWLAVHESDPFQSYYRRYENSGNRNGGNNRKRSERLCGKCSRGCRRQYTSFRRWQYLIRLTGMETDTGMKRQEW